MNSEGAVLQDSQGRPRTVLLGEDGHTLFEGESGGELRDSGDSGSEEELSTGSNVASGSGSRLKLHLTTFHCNLNFFIWNRLRLLARRNHRQFGGKPLDESSNVVIISGTEYKLSLTDGVDCVLVDGD
uniref:Uncharacterized protein n=1 Tax=Knipowitschia caucasica TaxID=637954 RepID=A0AAV2KEC2_KNICA